MKKTELTNRCRQIWRSYKQGSTLSKEDMNWMVENVFKFHPEWHSKADRGIERISTGRSIKYYTPCFYLHFKDGSKCDISWTKSIKNI